MPAAGWVGLGWVGLVVCIISESMHLTSWYALDIYICGNMTLGEEAGGIGIEIGIGIGIGIGISVATSKLKCSTILCLAMLFADPAVC